ncbi:type IV secretion system protein [Lelliottia sp. V89_10]|uniref:type IV secretion system protein n=1 Tax=Lelliottia wanjuensis TaxID=3050585 RepID=UPI00249F0BB7|nr:MULTISPECIES: type IV secretion system protein [unclassified Lelliottia]MDI3360318.1 type IV secretion system protein [Lelliottia sp. V89_13]MDK9549456.1 type IV secretion system protein [Lelliottia sp. V89_5]MDK9596129.1 type IV secretion system protein [Lelliottia sp. V89_10]
MSGMFVGVHESVINGLTVALGGQSDIYGDMIAPTMIGWMSLYVVISGYKAMAGKLQTPLPDVLWNLGVSGILLAFVTNANSWFDLVQAAIEGVSSSISDNDTGIWGVLDTLWESTQRLADSLYDADDDMVPVSGAIAMILTWVGTGAVVFVGGIINLTTEVTLKLLLTTGPLFIACLAWGWFRSMFENWMKAVVSCLLTVLFSSLALQMILNLMDKALTKANSTVTSDANDYMTTAVVYLGIGLLGSAVVMLSTKIATSLSGSSVSAAAAGMGMAAGAAAGYLGGKTLAPVAREAGKGIAKGGGKIAGYAGNAAMSGAEKAFNRYKMQQTLRKSSINNMARLNK